MKKFAILTTLTLLALAAVPSTGSATVVFSATADLDFSDAPCSMGYLQAMRSYHSGIVHSFAGSDVGRGYRVNGQAGLCGVGSLNACAVNKVVTTSGGGGSCQTYREVGSVECSADTYQAMTLVEVTDGGSESATASSPCISC